MLMPPPGRWAHGCNGNSIAMNPDGPPRNADQFPALRLTETNEKTTPCGRRKGVPREMWGEIACSLAPLHRVCTGYL